jgi:hypothetical protein
MKNFQLRGNNSAWAAVFQLLRGRTPAQLRGNIAKVCPLPRMCLFLQFRAGKFRQTSCPKRAYIIIIFIIMSLVTGLFLLVLTLLNQL